MKSQFLEINKIHKIQPDCQKVKKRKKTQITKSEEDNITTDPKDTKRIL